MADTDNNRIQKFTADGDYLDPMGQYGSGNGQFNSPDGVAVDSQGNVYVADTDNHRIQKFDTGGDYLTQWGTAPATGSSTIPGRGGGRPGATSMWRIPVTTASRSSTASGAYLAQWGSYGSGNGQFNYPLAWRWTARQRLRGGYRQQPHPEVRRRRRLSRPSGAVTAPATGSSDIPRAWRWTARGNVYVADTSNHRIQKFDTSGAYLTQWGSHGSGNGQFNYPYGVAVDAGQRLCGGYHNNRIQKFNTSGGYLDPVGHYGTGNGQFNIPTAWRWTARATSTWRIPIITASRSSTPAAHYLAQWGSTAPATGSSTSPHGVAVDGQGNVYVADTDNNRIQKFEASGRPISRLGR